MPTRSFAVRAYSRIPELLLLCAFVLAVLAFSLVGRTAIPPGECYPQLPVCTGYTVTVQAASSQAGAVSAFLGAVLLLVAAALGHYRRVFCAWRGPAPHRLRALSAALLVIASVALLLASAYLAYVPPPAKSFTIADGKLHIGLQGSNGVLDSASIQADAGVVLDGWYSVRWYANESGQYVGESSGPAEIVPAGQPLSIWQANSTTDYRVPRNSAYTVFFQDDSCSAASSTCGGNYTANASIDLVFLGPNDLPLLHFAAFSFGVAAYAGAMALAWNEGPYRHVPPWSRF